jgi:nucleotide-binding universal stress UspA family protein
MVNIKTILCPVDFFPGSQRAADYAIALAKNYRAKLILVHVVSPVLVPYELPFNTTELTDSLVEASKDQLKAVSKRAQSVTLETIARVGDVDIEIMDIAKNRHIDLVVMGSHGRRGFQKWFLGSHTERLLRSIGIPLLTISGEVTRKPTPTVIRRMMVLTDFSEGTSEAIHYAFSIGRECQSKITVMHVINDIDASISGRYRDPLIKSIRLQLESLIPDDARDVCNIETRVETGLPWRRILSILKKERYDLLVMNVHGKTMLERALIGSTAERVVRGAEIPVLVIPPIKMSKRKHRAAKKAA